MTEKRAEKRPRRGAPVLKDTEPSASPSHWRHLWNYHRALPPPPSHNNGETITPSLNSPSFILPPNIEIALWKDYSSLDEYLNVIIEFLNEHYVEDEGFRFSYKPEHLKWSMLHDAKQHSDLLISLRTSDRKQTIGFISACPCEVVVHDETSTSSIIDFVCVHKDFRGNRLCPLLYSMIHSKLCEKGILTSLKTTGSDISLPIAVAQYYHFCLNEERLIATEFLSKPLKARAEPVRHSELSLLSATDLPSAFKLLLQNNKKFKLAQQFQSPSQLGHVLLERENIVLTLVKRKGGKSMLSLDDDDASITTLSKSGDDKKSQEDDHTNDVDAASTTDAATTITDLVSIYFVQHQITTEGHALQGEYLTTAYLLYLCATTVSIESLIQGAAYEAKQRGADMLNILPIGEVKVATCRKVKAIPGSGLLKYYAYNFKNIRSEFQPSEMFVFPAI